jgi:hypothetical protein
LKPQLVWLFSLAFVACATKATLPAKTIAIERIVKVYIDKLQSEAILHESQILENSADKWLAKVAQAKSDNRRAESAAQGLGSDLDSGGAKTAVPNEYRSIFSSPWRNQVDILRLENLEPLFLGKKQVKPERKFYLSRTGSKSYKLFFQNLVAGLPSESFLDARLICDNDFVVKQALYTQYGVKGQEVRFRIFNSALNKEKIWFFPSVEKVNCSLKMTTSENRDMWYGIHLVEDKNYEQPTIYNNGLTGISACLLPGGPNEELGDMEKAFISAEFDFLTCPAAVEQLETKIGEGETLLSYKTFLEKAEKLNDLYLASAAFNDKKSLQDLLPFLKQQLDQGTRIKVLLSHSQSRNKEIFQALDELAFKYERFQVREYFSPHLRTEVKSTDKKNYQDLHLNLLIAINDNSNTAILGNADSKFVFKITKNRVVEGIANQFLSVWDHDSLTAYQRPTVMNVAQPEAPYTDYFMGEYPLVRYWLANTVQSLKLDASSILKKYLASTAVELVIVTEKLKITKELAKVITDLLERGAKIKIYTAAGGIIFDDAQIPAKLVDRERLIRLGQLLSIYKIKNQALLNSHFMLVDQKLFLQTSLGFEKTNNQEIGGGLMIYSDDVAEKVGEEIAKLGPSAEKINVTEKRDLVNQLLKW